MKVIITESQYNRAVDSYISYLLEPHEVRIIKNYPKSIFWVKDGKIIVEIEKQQYFWLHYQILADISRMFDLNYSETQSVIKEWLEQHPNLGVLTPIRSFGRTAFWLEQHHNLGVLTPEFMHMQPFPTLEQHHNLG